MPDAPVVASIRESPERLTVSLPSDSLSKRERHSRLPDSVLRDKRLSAQAKIVYAGLARHALKEGLVYIGQRRLADLVNFSQSMVARKISELRTLGHITVTSDARGRRNGYKLLSTTFMPWKVERKPYKKRVSIRSQAASYYNSREILDEILESK